MRWASRQRPSVSSCWPDEEGGHDETSPAYDEAQEAQSALDAMCHCLILDRAAQHSGGLLAELRASNSPLVIVVRHPGGRLTDLGAVLPQVHPLRVGRPVGPGGND